MGSSQSTEVREEAIGGPVHHPVVIVTGSRKLQEWWRVEWVLDQYKPRIVVEGNCRSGADAAARQWCTKRGLQKRSYTADWKRYGRAAGPIRNTQMLREWPTAVVLAFPVEYAENDGTTDCIQQAWSMGMVVEIFSNVWIAREE